MIEFMLFNSYINFVGFALMLAAAKTVIKDNFNALERFGLPILYVGIVPSLVGWVYFGVPIVVYSWQHAVMPFWDICYQYWFV